MKRGEKKKVVSETIKEKVILKRSDEGLGISSFVLGILSLVFFGGAYGILIGIIGLVLGIIQQKKLKTNLGRIGKILNIIGIILGIITIVFFMIQFQSGSFPTY